MALLNLSTPGHWGWLGEMEAEEAKVVLEQDQDLQFGKRGDFFELTQTNVLFTAISIDTDCRR